MDASRYSADTVLRNGLPLHLRAVRPDDKQELIDGFHRLTRESVYFRFLGSKPELTQDDLKYFTEIDFRHHVAIAALIRTPAGEHPIGIGRYIEITGGSRQRTAEVAFAVEDDYQNLGAGTLLFEHIIAIARVEGITRIQADVFTRNTCMLKIFQHSGYAIQEQLANGIVHIEFAITDSRTD